jgi:hypothetical protein
MFGPASFADLLECTIDGLDDSAGSIREFPIECLPVLDAASQELRPRRDRNILRKGFRKQAPELRMEPTQIVPAAVPMGANAVPQPHDFGKQLLSSPV